MRHFNTAGPCKPDLHYLLPATDRLPDVRSIVDGQGYFVLHAPRQTGKTTAMIELARQLTDEGRYVALTVSVETAAAYAGVAGQLDRAVLEQLRQAAAAWLPEDLRPPDFAAGTTLADALAAWCRASARPVVLFLDEADALRDDALVSLLRQLRAGYPRRPEAFPHSVCLVGLRDVRDYLVDGDRLGTASPFNIKVESLTLRDFTPDEVAELLRQHTGDTGQVFEDAAIGRVWHFGRGQPWLTNALARLCVLAVPDRSQPIEAANVEAAAQELVRRQDTHLDSLAARLAEPRVRQIVAPMIAGDLAARAWPQDDVRFALDLGLLRDENGLQIANPIYRQIVARTLAESTRVQLAFVTPAWLGEDGRLSPERALSAFLAFWRQNAEPLFRSASYHEIAPHLVLMAWLDRVANGGGRVEREYAIGSRRLDLLLVHGDVRLAIEAKAWHDGRPDPRNDGLAQLDHYLAGLGLDTGWLVVFDARTGRVPVEDRTSSEPATTPAGRQVTLVRA